MRRSYLLSLVLVCFSLSTLAQDICYGSMKKYFANRGDTVAPLQIVHRSKNQMKLTGGADYKIFTSTQNESMDRYLRKRCFVVSTNKDSCSFVNCRKLRYKKLRFGNWYAPCVLLGNKLYFSAVPLGSVIGQSFVDFGDAKLGGSVGEALATCNLGSHRVLYVIDGATGKVDYVNQEMMKQLFKDHPEWIEQYSKKTTCESNVLIKYLLELKALEK
ncbi:MAG: DUF6563 family protein [Bacteroidaceae bacterium]